MAKPQRDAHDRALEWALLGHQNDLAVPELQIKATTSPA